MTVVNPKSISGINSITMASGSDNLLTIHTTNTTERVRVNSDGDVIVGSGITVSPDGDIFATGVTTSTTFSGNFSGGTVSGTTGTFTGDLSIADAIVHTGDNSKIRFPDADRISFETGGTEIARFDQNQLFLIGATSAVNSSSAKVQIAHTNANARLDIARFSADNAPPYLEFHKSRSGTVGGNTVVQSGDELGRIRWSGNNGSTTNAGAEIRSYVDGSPGSNDMPTRMIFYTTPDDSATPSERLRITSEGKVGINESSPAATLDVEGSGVPVIVNSSNSNTYKIQLENAGSTVAYIGAASNEVYFANASAAEQARFTDSGLKLPSGRGIDFSATSDITGMESELLDDYEEGSYTCVLTGSGGGSHNITGSSYVKVGKQVTCQVTLANPGSNSVSGYWSFTLPFQAVQSSGYAYFGGYVSYTRHMPGYTEGDGNFSHIALHSYNGQSSAVLYKLRNGSGEANTLQGSLNTEAILAFTMVYNAAT